MFRRLATLIIGVGLATVAVPSGIVGAVTCSAPLPQGNDRVVLDPADFVERVDNPYLPMPPGPGGSTARPNRRARGSASM